MIVPQAFGALVVGGGVHGLATALELARRGVERVALVERHRLHHAQGSSHGAGRITRTTYMDARYVRLMQVAHAEDWPRLERDARRTLVHRADGVFFGPPAGGLEQYAAAVAAAGAPGVERLEATEARRRFPAFAFPDAPHVLHDRTGGVVAAADTLLALDRLCRIEGVHVLEDTRVLALELEHDPIAVVTDRGRLRTERLVITAGAWVGDLVPALATHLEVKRQHVGYFAWTGDPEEARPGRFPVWVYLGAPEDGVWYGLPEFGRPGIKAAFHATGGGGDDPDATFAPDPAALDRVRAFLTRQLSRPPGELLHAETCLYTNAPDEHFVVGPLPGDARVVVGAACSGHGFKFGPLMGRILAGLALDGRSGVTAFEEYREAFAGALGRA